MCLCEGILSLVKQSPWKPEVRDTFKFSLVVEQFLHWLNNHPGSRGQRHDEVALVVANLVAPLE